MVGELSKLVRPSGKKFSKRVGRGRSSGHGKTCGRGTKGSGSRKGRIAYFGFEGGQMPLVRRIPKRGFHSLQRNEYEIINLGQLNEKFSSGETVTREFLQKKGLVKSQRKKVKILGKGKIGHSLNVEIKQISKAAREKIKSAGGKVNAS